MLCWFLLLLGKQLPRKDQKYGGWFGSISQTGEPKETDKGASTQIYNNVGLTQYYFVTGDERALSHVLQSVEIHKTYAHDEEFDGYYMKLNRSQNTLEEYKKADVLKKL